MGHHRRQMAFGLILLGCMLAITACGPDENEPVRTAAPAVAPPVPISSRDAIINERLSRLQSQLTELDHKISEAVVSSRKINEDISALRQELAQSGVPAVPALTVTPGTPATAPSLIPPAPQVVTPAPAPAPPAASSAWGTLLVWAIILLILLIAIYFIIRLVMGPWSEEEDASWIDEGDVPYENEDENIQLSPEVSDGVPPAEDEHREPNDEPKP